MGLVAFVYGGSLSHGFAFDDWPLVVENPVAMWPPSRVLDLFDAGASGVTYRPVRMFSYMVDHSIAGGLEPSVFHATNVAYHAAAVLALYALAALALGSSLAAWLAAALFAVHPLGTEAVAYVAGRRDVLAGLFALLSLLAWWIFCERSARHGSATALGGTLVATLLAAILALGAKENAAVLPALAALLFVVQARRRGESLPRPSARTWVALALCVAVLAFVVDQVYAERVREAVARLGGEPLAPQPALSLRVLGQYGWLSLWPAKLSADYRPPAWELPTSPLDVPSIVVGIALVLVVALGAALTWRGRVAGAGLLWFVIALLPVLQIVPYREVVAERNAYLPLAGLALASGDLAASVARRSPRGVLTVGILLVGLLAWRAHARAAVWADDETLWVATLDARPSSVRAKHNLAIVYAKRGRLERARRELRSALEDAPEQIEVLSTLATVEGRLGNDPAAIELAERAVEIEPGAETLSFLGWARVAAGADASARKAFLRALRHEWRHAEARRGLEGIRARERQRRHLRHGRAR